MSERYYLIYSSWDKLPDKTKHFFISLFDHDHARANKFYNRFFLSFNIIHECAHILRFSYDINSSRYEDEQAVNLFAVALFRYLNEDDFLSEIKQDIVHLLGTLEKPNTKDTDIEHYFNEHYHEISENPSIYAYYQILFVYNALQSKVPLHVILSDFGLNNMAFEKQMPLRKYRIQEHPQSMVDMFKDVMSMYRLSLPKIIVVNRFTPRLQYVTNTL